MAKRSHPIFDKADYGLKDARNALAKFYRSFLIEFGVTPNMWSDLLTRYVVNPLNGISKARRSIVRGNLPKQLERDKVTFDSFLTGMRVLEGDRVDMYIVVHRGKRRTMKKISVDLGPEIENGITPNNPVVNNVSPKADIDAYMQKVVETGKDDIA